MSLNSSWQLQSLFCSLIRMFDFRIHLLLRNFICVVWEQTVHHNAYHQDPYAQEFGINISNELAQVEARVLPAPRVRSYLVWSDVILPSCRLIYVNLWQKLMSFECFMFISLQLKYHDTGREKECLPQVGQWNMMNKVCAVTYNGLY